MRIESVELRIVALPLVTPFATAHGRVDERRSVLVRVVGDDGEGWGECAALPDPTYSAEYVEGALLTLRRHLVPRLFAAGRDDPREPVAAHVGDVLSGVVGHPMAKAALELALLDAELRGRHRSLAEHLLGDRPPPPPEVPAGATLGLCASPDATADAVATLVARGYGRVKMKIAPGLDLDHARAARAAAGPDAVLVLDANGAYRLDGEPGAPDDARRLGALDDLGIACLEQPLGTDALLDHAELARRLATPLCLDESLTSAAATAQALDMGACSVVCVKAPRYGSWLTAVEVLDRCAGTGVPAWIGGMLDTGLGRAANLVLADHPACTLPGDVPITTDVVRDDVVAPQGPVDPDGPLRLALPTGPGLGVDLDEAALVRLTTHVETIRADEAP
ncbi:MAG: o-succinylbenzoate synthase [Acidimicrobiales bacterium]|nr:o-succinylbenzoate synthase [Acidimicrobiales bacterium]